MDRVSSARKLGVFSIPASLSEETLTPAYEEMQILGVFDLTRSYRSAVHLAECDAKTVQHYVNLRDAGLDLSSHLRRPRLIDPYVEEIEELVEQSRHSASRSPRAAGLKHTTYNVEADELSLARAVAAVARELTVKSDRMGH